MQDPTKYNSYRGRDLAKTRSKGPPPLLPAIVPPSAFAPVPPGSAPDGLLKAAVRNDTLRIIVPYPVDELDPLFEDAVFLLLDGERVGPPIMITDDNKNLPLEFDLPADVRTEGVHQLGYSLYSFFFGEELKQGPAINIIVDLTPPGLPFLGRMEFDREIEQNGLTSQKLTELGDILKGKVPSYNGYATGDIIVSMIDGVPISPPHEVGAGQVGGDVIINFSRAALEAAGDGRKRFDYEITDRAGNKSSVAEPTYINTALLGAISDLGAPKVAAYDDGIINDADARLPVTVEIPGNARIEEGDVIVVSWGGQLLPPALVGPSHVGQDPLFEVLVPYTTVRMSWTNGVTPVDVSYTVYRGGLALGTSPATPVEVNMDLPGGPDPDPETPVHDQLDPLLVQGASGEDNVIPPADSGLDATAFIPFRNKAGADVFRLGDEVEVIWDGQVANNWRPVTSGEIAAGLPIEVTIPASIVSIRSGDIPVYYRIRRQANGSSNPPIYNITIGPVQLVLVSTTGDLPGGGQPLPLSVFTNRDVDRNALSRTIVERDNGSPLSIPLYVNKKLGDKILVNVQLYWGVTGTSDPHGTPYTHTHTVGPDDEGTDWRPVVPKEFFFQLIGQGRPAVGHARATYTVSNGATGAGGISSGETPVILDMRV